MTEAINPDELLDSLQQAIDMIRRVDPTMGDQCDSWERRLYGWHDALLRILGPCREQHEHTGSLHFQINGDDARTFTDIGPLKLEVVAAGDRIIGRPPRDKPE